MCTARLILESEPPRSQDAQQHATGMTYVTVPLSKASFEGTEQTILSPYLSSVCRQTVYALPGCP